MGETNHTVPKLTGDARAAVEHRGGHVQIVAAAGSGKTEVVSQRVASLLADGEPPESIVAFTFTNKAAIELKERVRVRAEALLGTGVADTLGRLFVGTIHAYCLRVLQTNVPRYERYTPLDDHQLFNLMFREANRLGLRRFDPKGRTTAGIERFLHNVDVIENELIEPRDLPRDGEVGEFADALESYYDTLDRYQVMSFGMQIVRAVEELRKPEVHAAVTSGLRHLIVDEYQDVNPAQEELVRLLAKPEGNADVVVVGDDDQAIYQWRGSDVANIVTFAERLDGVTTFELLNNRRSTPAIVNAANAFARTIPNRLDKQMSPFRSPVELSISVRTDVGSEIDEAEFVADSIARLHDAGVPYRDVAILVRSSASYPKLLAALESRSVPVQPGGRVGLFEQPEAHALGKVYAWLTDQQWKDTRWGYAAAYEIDVSELLDELNRVFDCPRIDRVATLLDRWKTRRDDRSIDLIRDYYTLLAALGVPDWDLGSDITRSRLGTLARFSHVLADYELAIRRARVDADVAGEQVGGQAGGEWYLRNLSRLMFNYSSGQYKGFDGEDDFDGDSVALTTVHRSKGLEWPYVFVPSLTAKRFPSSYAGKVQNWIVPRDQFAAARYEGSDDDERRLFYVALTRGRDWVGLSAHDKVNVQKAKPSPYILEVQQLAEHSGPPTPNVEGRFDAAATDVTLTYSDLAAFIDCGQSYLLRSRLGFMPPISAELGYGNAVHHLMRLLAERAKSHGSVPSTSEVNALLDSEFFLPFANKAAHREMKESARQLVRNYLDEHGSELKRTWATEYPFELYLPGVVVRGRADVIYDEGVDGQPVNLTLVDYKTATGIANPLQLQVYADAGRREGLTVGKALVHDMKSGQSIAVPIDQHAVSAAEATVIATVDELKAGRFEPKPEKSKCARCDVRLICKARNSIAD